MKEKVELKKCKLCRKECNTESGICNECSHTYDFFIDNDTGLVRWERKEDLFKKRKEKNLKSELALDFKES